MILSDDLKDNWLFLHIFLKKNQKGCFFIKKICYTGLGKLISSDLGELLWLS